MDNYERRATVNMPTSAAEWRASIAQMLDSGLTHEDVARILKVDPLQVKRLLGNCESCE